MKADVCWVLGVEVGGARREEGRAEGEKELG